MWVTFLLGSESQLSRLGPSEYCIPVLIPTLIGTPMTVFNARALASLVTVAGNALSRRLTVVLTALVKITESTDDSTGDELRTAVDEAVQALLSSISDVEGLNSLMLLLLGW